MKAISLIILIIAALSISAYSEKIKIYVKYEDAVKPIKIDYDKDSVLDIILAWKKKTKHEGEYKIQYASGKEIDEISPLEYTQIINGVTLYIVKV